MIEKILKTQQQNIFGIIQVGANIGQELHILTSHSENVYLFEPLTEAFDILSNNISKYSDIKIFKLALGDKNEFKKINISNTNFGASSSLLEPSLHLDYFPEIKFDDFEEVEIKRFDEIDYNFKANFLILDVQGYELKVIKGFGDKLRNIDYIYTEFSTKELYKDTVLIGELELNLAELGYIRTKTRIASNKPQGDALFVKKEKYSSISLIYYKVKSFFQLSKIYMFFNLIRDYRKLIYLFKEFVKKFIL